MTTYDNFTITELVALGKTAENYFKSHLGYDEATFKRIWLSASGAHRVDFTLHDTFQNSLPPETTYKVGWSVTLDLEGFWDKVTSWPTREQRELTILARKMAAIDADLCDIRSAQVLSFIARLQPDIDALRAQIADLRGDDDTVEIT